MGRSLCVIARSVLAVLLEVTSPHPPSPKAESLFVCFVPFLLFWRVKRRVPLSAVTLHRLCA